MSAPWTEENWHRVAVYGLGVSGRAAAELLLARGVEVVGLDRRSRDELDPEWTIRPGLELLCGQEPENLPAGIDAVVVSPGVPMDRPLLVTARDRGIPVIAEVELAYPLLNGPLVGITGSNGKSTTTALTGRLLEASGLAVEVCGNIGAPLSSRVAGEPGRIFVTELSSFQLEGIVRLRPRAAALLNISADHLDRYPSLEAYASAKGALFRQQTTEDLAVLNADDPLVRELGVRARRRLFSRLGQVEDGCFLADGWVLEVSPGGTPVQLFRRDDVPVPGLHNLENAMAAALLAREMGSGADGVRAGLGGFKGLPHRMQPVPGREGVRWIDDSKATNPGATRRSLEGFADGSVHLILGGRSKRADLAALAEIVARKAIRVYLIGEAAAEFQTVLDGLTEIELSGALEEAVRSAAGRVGAGEVVLLSPACASFDQYASFAERGEHFQRLVLAVDGVEGGEEARA